MVEQRVSRTVGAVGAVGVVALVVIGMAAMASGQGARPATPANESLDGLLTEVRALRTDINQAANTSIRAQLFVARLQLQEQRVNAVGRELSDVQSRLATVMQGQTTMRQRLAATEEAEARLPVEDRNPDIVQSLKLQIEQGQRSEQELRAQESGLIGTVVAEQSRWTDFNDRLDALERSLPSASVPAK